jgi:chitin disaccharide deacetylase
MRMAGKSRRLVVNADDFGLSSSVNAAIIQAHQTGILTSASLMVNGEAFDEAVALSRCNPGLGVGLHLTLVCGRSALGQNRIPGLVNSEGRFRDNAIAAGCSYFFNWNLRRELEMEIDAQFARFNATGLVLDHVNGHLNIHMHPVVYGILVRHAEEWGIKAIRVTRDSAAIDWRIGKGKLLYRLSHSLVFSLLGARAFRQARNCKLRHTQNVFGLLQNGRVNEEYICALLPRLPLGDSELYSHPSVNGDRHELAALVSAAVKNRLREQGIELIRYQDL